MNDPTTKGYAPISDELIDDICDRWLEPDGPGGSFYADRYDIAPHVVTILRSLPVEQRMEAMGMVRDGRDHLGAPLWRGPASEYEADRPAPTEDMDEFAWRFLRGDIE